MTKPALDDFQAVRTLVETLEPFATEDRERILRWAREKLGMTGAALLAPITSSVGHGPAGAQSPPSPDTGSGRGSRDIKSFIQDKSPKSDRQLAAAVAYYYAFEAPPGGRKQSINSQDLIDACRKAGIRRPTNPGQTLRNSAHAGYLDKATDAGHYKLNAVGENLVAMVLPDEGADGATAANPKATKRRQRKRGRKAAAKKR